MNIELNALHRNSYGLILLAIFLGTFLPLSLIIITSIAAIIVCAIAEPCRDECNATDPLSLSILTVHCTPSLRVLTIVWFTHALTHGWLSQAFIFLGNLLK